MRATMDALMWIGRRLALFLCAIALGFGCDDSAETASTSTGQGDSEDTGRLNTVLDVPAVDAEPDTATSFDDFPPWVGDPCVKHDDCPDDPVQGWCVATPEPMTSAAPWSASRSARRSTRA